MIRIIKSEIYKVTHHKAFYVIMGILAANIVYTMFFDTGSENTETLMKGIFVSVSGVTLVLGFIISEMACEDYRHGMMKNIVVTGVSRTSIYFGRLIGCYAAAGMLIAVNVVIELVADYIKYGMGKTVSADIILTGIVLQLVNVILITTIIYAVGTIIRNTKFAVLLAYIWLIFDILGGELINHHTVDSFATYSSDYYGTAVGTVKAFETTKDVLFINLGIYAVVSAVLLIIGLVIFKKSEY